MHPRSRPVGIASCLALALLTATSALGQSASTSSNSAARYVPKDKLVFFLEFDGLDAHADGWKKTAAYKILNDTPTGAMLEDLATQLLNKVPAMGLNGAERVAIVKHLAKSGFAIAAGGDPNKDKPDYVVFILRDAYKNKDVRPLFARALQALGGPGVKPKQEIKAGHKVATGTMPPGGTAFAWWVDESKKADILLVNPSPNSSEFILETIDGKRPNALDHPTYKEMTQPEAGFEQTGCFFVDGSFFRDPKVPPILGFSEIKRLDLRWGFQDNALMSITRIAAPSPRKGVLAMLDGPSFDKSSLPPLHEALGGFTVVSFDAKAAITQLGELLKAVYPPGEQQLNGMIDGVKAKTKLRLKEDILSHIGPRAAFFELPDKVGSAPTLPPAGLATMMLSQMGRTKIPKAAILIDIDNPAAFGKVLDELMSTFNREMKAKAKANNGGDSAKGRAPATLSFTQATAEPKTYVLNLPKEQADLFGPNFKPAIRVGPKQVAIAINSETARLALETKVMWTPPASLATAFQALPSKLRYLSLSDPKDTTPAILASLPGKLQTAINQVLLAMMPPMPGAVAAAPAPAAGGGGFRPKAAPRPDGGGAPAPSSAPTPGANAALPGPGAMPAMTIVLQVDAAKLPSADSIKALLFPSLFAVETNDEGIKIISRQAFFDVPDPTGFGAGFQMGKGMFKNGKFDPTGMIPGVPGAAPGANPSGPGAPVTPGSKGGGVSSGKPD